MATVLARKSRRDLRLRKARTFFTVATIAAAVTGLWLFAVPVLIGDAMQERIESDLLWDLRLSPNEITLTDADIQAIRTLPNIAAVEARVTTKVDLRAADRTSRAGLVGVDDFDRQEVNAVRLLSGTIPRTGEVLSDPQNARSGRYTGGIGDTILLGGHSVVISGIATSLEFGATVDDDAPIFYLQVDRLQAASGRQGTFNWIDLRVHDHSSDALAAAGDTVRQRLRLIDPEITFWRALEIRQPGDWPEKESFDNVIRLTYIIAALGMASASLMVYTTMSTIVREQTREIGIMKAVGAGRRAVTRSYLRTAAILGATGTILGSIAGISLSNLLVGFAGREFSGVEPAVGAPPWVLALSVAVGLGGTTATALPAVLRATRRPVIEALNDHGVRASLGTGPVDRAVRAVRFGPRSLRLGLRNAARRKARSVVTGVQVGFAVGTALGFFALGITVQDVAARSFDGEGGDIRVFASDDAGPVIRTVPGVEDVIAVSYANVGVAGDSYELQGQTAAAAALHDNLRKGRWFTTEEEASQRPVVVLGPAIAKTLDANPGDRIEVESSTGTITALEVVGIDSLMVGDGNVLYAPLSIASTIEESTGARGYYVITASSDEDFIDGVASDIRETLATAEMPGNIEVRYIEREAELSSNRTILTLLMIMGLPVIAIGMIGLVNTMTMNVIDRTREIGILRSIGARAHHIGRMIRAEALILAAVGWIASIPAGFAIGTLLTKLLSDGFGADFALRFPLWPLPYALAGTLLLATVVVRSPVRRAVRLSPGTALRYE